MTSRPPESPERLGEFELIAKLFAPLARNFPGSFALADDVALLEPASGREIVLKTDSVIEGVHFLRGDPAARVAQKALRRALSDLAAKSAEPSVYLLALALPSWPDMAWLEAFARGLAGDQAEFGIVLAGGETNATPGPVTISVTMMGSIPKGALIRRNGARHGDLVFVTGTIGDSGGGLTLLRGQSDDRTDSYLARRYLVPEPRMAFGQKLRGIANAAIDVSDGLTADLGHVADASRVRIEIDAARVPLSEELRQLWPGADGVARAATAGDDYEIAFIAPEAKRDSILDAAHTASTRVTEIGRVVAGEGVALVDGNGDEIPVARRGYTHF
ncbi:MAG TPA: thiamine-phosphate kinase [Rhizomicrobium sp.]|jgi:thiamine-monophosphate kinase